MTFNTEKLTRYISGELLSLKKRILLPNLVGDLALGGG